jgi:sigma-B regulation protein RsbU (phosphoserine phosphatase)
MMLFAIHFPERSVLDRRHPGLKWLVLVPLSASSAVIVWFSGFKQIDMGMNRAIEPFLPSVFNARQILGMIAIGSFFALLGHKSGTSSNKDSRRRLKILWIGSAAGLTPGFLITLYSLGSGRDWGSGIPEWLLFAAIAALTTFPVTLAYVIVVQRAMEIGMVVRQSMKYALAKGGLIVLRGLIAAVAIAVIAGARQNENEVRQALGVALGASALLVLRTTVSQKVMLWMDRKFFREAYSSEQVLGDLASEVRRYVAAPRYRHQPYFRHAPCSEDQRAARRRRWVSPRRRVPGSRLEGDRASARRR